MLKNVWSFALLGGAFLGAASESEVASISLSVLLEKAQQASVYKEIHEMLSQYSSAQRQELLDCAATGNTTALHTAALSKNVISVYFLLREGANMYVLTQKGNTAADLFEEERFFWHYYVCQRSKLTYQREWFSNNQLKEIKKQAWLLLLVTFNGSIQNPEILISWGSLEKTFEFLDMQWLRNELLSTYDVDGKSLLCKAIERGRIDWIIFLFNHAVDSSCMIEGSSITYADIIKQKIQRHTAKYPGIHEVKTCHLCSRRLTILLLLQVYEACFEPKK